MASSSVYPSPEDYPEFDPIVLKCIGYLHVGGKESRRGLKELYQELVNDSSANQKSRGSSPSMKVRYPSFENSPKKGVGPGYESPQKLSTTPSSNDNCSPTGMVGTLSWVKKRGRGSQKGMISYSSLDMLSIGDKLLTLVLY